MSKHRKSLRGIAEELHKPGTSAQGSALAGALYQWRHICCSVLQRVAISLRLTGVVILGRFDLYWPRDMHDANMHDANKRDGLLERCQSDFLF